MYKNILILFGFVFFAATANAATLYLIPEAQVFNVGQNFIVDLRVDTEDVDINAVKATVRFSTDVLELISVDREVSAFSFWVEDPTILNDEGTLEFIGGTSKGISGNALEILRMKFKAKEVGSAVLSVTDATVTASDGKGTNVLLTTQGANIAVGPNVIVPELMLPPAPIGGLLEEPKEIEREALLTAVKPEKPQMRVPLYPDQSQWYNYLGRVIVLWEVPDDVIKIATAITQSPNEEPQNVEQKLSTGKDFGILSEGVWYVHIQFKNNIGWGEIAHYKIAIDLTAPLPFEITVEKKANDNAFLIVRHETNDSLSGIAEYIVFVDDGDSMRTDSNITELPPQKIGNHTIFVRAIDSAGNGISDSLEIEVPPLPAPILHYVPLAVSHHDPIFINGGGEPFVSIDVIVRNENNGKTLRRSTVSNEHGDWTVVIEEVMLIGEYTVTVIAKNDRGAVSHPVEAGIVEVFNYKILDLGFITLEETEVSFMLVIVLLFMVGASFVAWKYLKLRKKHNAYAVVIGRDIKKIRRSLEQNIEELEKRMYSERGIDSNAKLEIGLYIKELKKTIAKMENYLEQELERFK